MCVVYLSSSLLLFLFLSGGNVCYVRCFIPSVGDVIKRMVGGFDTFTFLFARHKAFGRSGRRNTHNRNNNTARENSNSEKLAGRLLTAT